MLKNRQKNRSITKEETSKLSNSISTTPIPFSDGNGSRTLVPCPVKILHPHLGRPATSSTYLRNAACFDDRAPDGRRKLRDGSPLNGYLALRALAVVVVAWWPATQAVRSIDSRILASPAREASSTKRRRH